MREAWRRWRLRRSLLRPHRPLVGREVEWEGRRLKVGRLGVNRETLGVVAVLVDEEGAVVARPYITDILDHLVSWSHG